MGLPRFVGHREADRRGGAIACAAGLDRLTATSRLVCPRDDRGTAGSADELRTFELIALDDRLLETAAVLDPANLRSVDAIHLAAAGSLGADLDVIVSYDIRMLEGARVLGLPTERPS